MARIAQQFHNSYTALVNQKQQLITNFHILFIIVWKTQKMTMVFHLLWLLVK